MKTKIQEQAPEFTFTEEYKKFKQTLRFPIALSSQIVETVSSLLKFDGTESDWRLVSNCWQWSNADKETLLFVAMLVYNCRYGHFLLEKILPTNVLELKHFEIMAQDWKNANTTSTLLVIQKVKEVAQYCDQNPRGRYLAELFAYKGVPCLATTSYHHVW